MPSHLPDFVMTLARLAVWMVLLAVLFIPLERLFDQRRQPVCRTQFLTDLGWYYLNGLVPSLILGMPLAFVAHAAPKILPAAITGFTAHWPLWDRALATMIVGEIGFYWGHRLTHEIPLLWRFHAIHHSAERLDWLVNSRAHPVDIIFTRLFGFIPVFALGLADPLAGQKGLVPILVLMLSTVWSFFIHANLRWRFGKLEWLIATPGFHHWHHSNDGKAFTDKNYASMFPWLDWIFGTMFLPRDRMPIRYGIDAPMPSGLIGQLLEPFETRSPQPAVAGDPQPAVRPRTGNA